VKQLKLFADREPPGAPIKELLTNDTLLGDLVRNSDKGRFEILEETPWVIGAIRCCQGHSDKRIDGSLIQSQPATSGEMEAAGWKQVYHGTSRAALYEILRSGAILPGGKRGEDFERDVHFSPYPPGDKRLVAGMRFTAEVSTVWDATKMVDYEVPLRISSNGVVLCPKAIPTKYLVKAFEIQTGAVLYHASAKGLVKAEDKDATYTGPLGATSSAPFPGRRFNFGLPREEVAARDAYQQDVLLVNCPRCGSKFVDGQLYCQECGFAVVEPSAMPEDLNNEVLEGQQLGAERVLAGAEESLDNATVQNAIQGKGNGSKSHHKSMSAQLRKRMQDYERNAIKKKFKSFADRWHNDPWEQENQKKLGHGPDWTLPYLQSLEGGFEGVTYVWPHQIQRAEEEARAQERKRALGLDPNKPIPGHIRQWQRDEARQQKRSASSHPRAATGEGGEDAQTWEEKDWTSTTWDTEETPPGNWNTGTSTSWTRPSSYGQRARSKSRARPSTIEQPPGQWGSGASSSSQAPSNRWQAPAWSPQWWQR
jgi:RNA:NAD 2'-phosphotransferase (TPT1/KptA family)